MFFKTFFKLQIRKKTKNHHFSYENKKHIYYFHICVCLFRNVLNLIKDFLKNPFESIAKIISERGFSYILFKSGTKLDPRYCRYY
jgi:hypothetical protein